MSNNVFKPSIYLYICWLFVGFILIAVIIGFFIIISATIRQFCTTLTLKEEGFEFKKGWLNVQHKEISYNKINSVETKVDILGKYLNYGTVQIFTGNDRDSLTFAGVDNVKELKRQLQARVAQ